MKIIQKIILLLFILLLSVSNKNLAQSGYSHTMAHPFSDTIPYEFIDNKIIITGSINGKPAKFLFDTGAAISLFRDDLSEFYDMEESAKSQMIKDINGKQSTMKSVRVKNLKIGTNFHLEEFPAVTFPVSIYYKALGVAGLIGSDIFKETTATIRSREKQLVIHYPERPANLTREMGIRMTDMEMKVPVFTVNMGNISRKVIFDSGAYGLISLSKTAYKAMNANAGAESVAVTHGTYGIGIGGTVKQSPQDYARVKGLEISGKKFRNIKSVTKDKDEVLIGIQLIDYGDVVIDFAKRRFYFFPFDDSVADMEKGTEQWSVFLGSSVDESGATVILVYGTIGDVGLTIGERVWSINGIDLKDVDFSKTVIRQYMDELEGDEAYLMVGESKDKARKVIARKI